MISTRRIIILASVFAIVVCIFIIFKKNQEPKKLTKQSFENLRKEGIPDNILKGLQSLENKEFPDEKDFWEAIEKQLGTIQFDSYKELILKHAVDPNKEKWAKNKEKWPQQIEFIKSIRDSTMLYISWSIVLMGVIVVVIEGKVSFLKKEFDYGRLFLIPVIVAFFGFSINYGLSTLHSIIGFLDQNLGVGDLKSPFKINYCWDLQVTFFLLGLVALTIFLLFSVNLSSIERKKKPKKQN